MYECVLVAWMHVHVSMSGLHFVVYVLKCVYMCA